jgi:Flp pilus assembly protein TadB
MGAAAARAAIPRQDRGRGYRRGSHRGGGRGHSSRQPSQPADRTRGSRVWFFLCIVIALIVAVAVIVTAIVVAGVVAVIAGVVAVIGVVVVVSLNGTVIAVGPRTIGKRRSHRRQQGAGVR